MATQHKEIDQQTLEKSSQQKFVEECILNHFLERRIGYDTVTSFKIHLRDKMNEVMPMFIVGWNLSIEDLENFVYL